MNHKWQITVEGIEAEDAIESFNDSVDFKLEWEVKNELTRDAGFLAVLATIFAITGSAISIAEQLRKWRDNWKDRTKNGKKTIDKIILIQGNNRLVLDNATEDQILSFIKNFKS